MGLRGIRGAVSVIAAVLLTVALSGCGGEDKGLSAEDMAQISAAADAAVAATAVAEQAKKDAAAAAVEAEQAKKVAGAAAVEAEQAKKDAAAAEAKAEQAGMDAAVAEAVAEQAKKDAAAAAVEAEQAKMDAAAAQMAADAAQAELDARAEPEPYVYNVTDPGGTREYAEDRAAAQRIAESVGSMVIEAARPALDLDTDGDADTAGLGLAVAEDVMANRIRGGVSIASLAQAPVGQDPMLSLEIVGGSELSTDTDSADTDAPVIPGFTGLNLMKNGPGAITQRALAYSDIERSVRAWGDVYRYNADIAGAALGSGIVSEGGRTHLRIGGTDGTNDQLLAMIDGRITITHGLSTTTGVTTRDIAAGGMVAGSYGGAAGQYVFTGATQLSWDGSHLSTVAANTTEGVILFRAVDPDVVVPDRDYLAFGIWTEIPDNPTLANPGRVRPFVHGNAGPLSNAQVAALSGEASYGGGAVGHWATRAAGSHLADQGRFTASAALDADFDGRLGHMVLSGQIAGFTDEMSGEEMLGWIVNLNGGRMSAYPRTRISADANVEGTSAVELAGDPMLIDIDGTTTGSTGSTAWSGVWEAWLFGNNPNDRPTGVAGNFQAAAGTAQPMTTPEGRINQFTDQGFAGVVGAFAGRPPQ